MATSNLVFTSITSATGWTGATTGNLGSSDDARATGGTVGELILGAITDAPGDFGSQISVQLVVEARTQGTVARAKSLLVELLDGSSNVLQSFTTTSLTGSDAVYSSSVFNRTDNAAAINAYQLRLTVQEGGGMADTATVEIDRAYVVLDYNVAVSNDIAATGVQTFAGAADLDATGTLQATGAQSFTSSAKLTPTNLLEEANNLGGTGWFPNANCTVTANYANDPDGVQVASRIIDNSAGGTGNVQTSNTIALEASTAYTAHIALAPDQLSHGRLQIGSLGTLDLFMLAELSARSVVSSGANVQSAEVFALANGYTWLVLKFTSDATDTTGTYLVRATDAIGATVDLDGTSSILAVGAWLEKGWNPTPPYAVLSADIAATGAQAFAGAADLDATGTLAAAAAQVLTAAADLDATGTLQATGVQAFAGVADLDAVGSLVATGAQALAGVADLDATGDLIAAGALSWASTAVLESAAASDISATGAQVFSGAADLDATGDLDAAGAVTVAGAADLRAVGSLAGSASISWTSAAALTEADNPNMIAAGVFGFAAAADLDAVGALAAAGAVVLTGNAAAGLSAGLSASAVIALTGAVSLSGAGRLVAVGADAFAAVADLDALGELLATGALNWANGDVRLGNANAGNLTGAQAQLTAARLAGAVSSSPRRGAVTSAQKTGTLN